MVDFMEDEFIYRQMQTTDGFAFGNLVQSSPDTGRVRAKAIYQLDPYQVAVLRHSDTVGIVVESCEMHELVGAGLISFKRGLFEGELCNYALLHSLVVHPNYRRQGIATELNKQRLACISQRLGDNALIVASIQQGNEGSLLVARKWCTQLVRDVHATLSKMRTSPPNPLHNVTVRMANANDLEEIALRQNQFYEKYNLYEPTTAKILSIWLAQTVFEDPFRHYYLAVDQRGNILAGMAIVEQYKLMSMQIEQMPMIARLLNKFFSVVPQSGILKQLTINQIWHAPKQLVVAQYLWETVRWEWRNKGNNMVCFFDPRSPIKEVVQQPFWMPKSKFIFAIRGTHMMDENRLIYN